MPTINEALARLGIHHTTLGCWMKTLKITPQYDQATRRLDGRIRIITQAEIDQLFEFRRAKDELRCGWRQRPVSARRINVVRAAATDEGYPYSRWAREHNLDTRTVTAAVKGRRDRGRWVAPSVALVEGKLDGAGQRALWERYHTLTRFTVCQRCPHATTATLPTSDTVDDK